MTVHKRSAGDLVDAPFLDDAERAESAWLIARDADPGAPAPSAAIASEYAELEHLLGDLPHDLHGDGWQDDVLRIATAPAPAPALRPWWRRAPATWALGGALVAAATAAAWLLVPRTPAELELAIRHTYATRGDEIAVDDHLVIQARPRESADLRVYRAGGTLVARCPDGPACRTAAPGEYTLDVLLDAPGRYHVILVVGPVSAPPDAAMDDYLRAARAAHARVVRPEPIDVH